MIVRPARPLLGSYVISPENNPIQPVIVQTSDFELLRSDNVPRVLGRTPVEIESDEEEVTPIKSPMMQAPPDVAMASAPGGAAMTAENSEKSSIDGFNANVVKVRNLTMRLAESSIDDETFGKLAATLDSIGVDAVETTAKGDMGAMQKAIRLGCDREHLDALVEHVNSLLFNATIHARNEEYEKAANQPRSPEWTYQWTEENPVGVGETDWKSHSSCSEQVFFKDFGRDPHAFAEMKSLYEGWDDDETLGKLAKVALDQGLLTLKMYTCHDCGYHTVATNRVCPFCKKH